VTRIWVGHPRNQAWFYSWKGKHIFFNSKYLDLFGIPPVLLFNGYQDSFVRGRAIGART